MSSCLFLFFRDHSSNALLFGSVLSPLASPSHPVPLAPRPPGADGGGKGHSAPLPPVDPGSYRHTHWAVLEDLASSKLPHRSPRHSQAQASPASSLHLQQQVPVANHAWRLPPCAETQNQTLPKTQNNAGAVHILISLEPQQLVVFVGCEKMKRKRKTSKLQAQLGRAREEAWKAVSKSPGDRERPGFLDSQRPQTQQTWQLATSPHSTVGIYVSRPGAGAGGRQVVPEI